MTLPAQAQLKVDQANAIIAQLNGSAAPGADEALVAVDESSAAASVPGFQQAAAGQPVAGQGNAEDVELLKQQYRSLQGMYNSLNERHRDNIHQMESMRVAFTSAQTQSAAAPPVQTGAAPTILSAGEIEEYTPEFFTMMERWIAPLVQRLIAPLVSEVQQFRNIAPVVGNLNNQVTQLTNRTVQTAEERFFEAVAGRVPDWQQINATTDFHGWLRIPDPLSGMPKQALLDDARRSLDVNRVVSIFNAYTGASPPAGGASASSLAATELASQAGPGVRKVSPTPVLNAQQGRVYSKADLNKLYADQREGRYKGKDAEFKQLETELIAAMNTGRYRN